MVADSEQRLSVRLRAGWAPHPKHTPFLNAIGRLARLMHFDDRAIDAVFERFAPRNLAIVRLPLSTF